MAIKVLQNTDYAVSHSDAVKVRGGRTLTEVLLETTIFDVSARFPTDGVNGGNTYTLSGAIGMIPANNRKGGMMVKFIQDVYATYEVEKTEGLATQPTGTALVSASDVVDGVYTAAQLNDFDTLPSAVDSTVTYYFAATEDDTTTYTQWVVKKLTVDSSEYVQWRYVGTAVTGNPNPFLNTANWQSSKYIVFDTAQSLSDDEKIQAQENIGIDTVRDKYGTHIGDYAAATIGDYRYFQKIDLPAGKYVLYVTYPKMDNVSTLVSIENTGRDFLKKWFDQPLDGETHAYYFESEKQYNRIAFGPFDSSIISYVAITGSIYRYSETKIGKVITSLDIINNVEEGGSDKALSAEQGKELNKKFTVEKEKNVTFKKAQPDTYATMVIENGTVTFTKVASIIGNSVGFILHDVCKNGRKYKLSFDYTNNTTLQLEWQMRANIGSNTGELGTGVIMYPMLTGHCESEFIYDSQYNVCIFTLGSSVVNGSSVVLSNFSLCEVSDVKDVCAEVMDALDDYNDDTSTWDSAYYYGEKVDVVRHRVKFKQVANAQVGQGMAIFGNTMFRLSNGGVCRTCDMSLNNRLIATFNLGSNGSGNHANTAQFAPSIENGKVFPYLYVACCTPHETYGQRCFVEEVTENSATLVQTISIDPSIIQTISIIAQSRYANVTIGDDGYIYMITGRKVVENSDVSGIFRIWKFRKVLVSEGDVTLGENDIVSYIEVETPYVYAYYVWQGSKVYDGKCYLMYGNVDKKRGFFVFDLYKKCLSTIVDLSPFVNKELEDFDFSNGTMWIVDSNNGCYNAKFVDEPIG